MFNLVKEGMQSKERYLVPPNQSIDDIPADVQHLYLYGFSDYKGDKLILSSNSLQQLKSITIGNHCFKHVCEFVIDGLDSLESVIIGYDCFKTGGTEHIEGLCRITNCPNLRQLEIGDHSFCTFQSFEISNVDSLQSIEFDRNCFEYADLSLKGE